VHYLCKVMTYSYKICVVGASGIGALNDRFTTDLSYFSRSQESRGQANIGSTRVAQIVTAAHTDL